jgi:hypothetical protein
LVISASDALKRAGFTVANANAVVFDVNIPVENHARRSIQLHDESAQVKHDRRQAHHIERLCDECASATPARRDGYFDQTPTEGSENAFSFNAQLTHF